MGISENSRKEILTFIQKFVTLNEDEANRISSCFEEVIIKKRQMVVQPGFTAKARNYIIDGALRSYVVNKLGQEHTIAFAIKDWWIID